MNKWNNISDQDLDELFKKAALSQNEPVFQEADWERFSIGQNIGKKKDRKFLVPFLLLILLGLGYSYVNYYPSSNKVAVERGNLNQNKTTSEKNTNALKENAKALEIKKNTEEGYLTTAPEISVQDTKTGILYNKNEGVEGYTKPLKSTAVFTSSKMANSSVANKTTSSLTGFEEKDLSSEVPQNSVNEWISNKNQYNAHLLNSLLPFHDLPEYVIEKPEVKQSQEKQQLKRRPVNLYFGYSPDFSSVVKNSFLKMGHNWSFMAEYELSERWSILSGIVSSNKYYKTVVPNMSWPESWGNKPNGLSEIKGECSVLDIPLNLRFNIKQSPTTTMFLTGGVSSFLFLSEKYDGYAENSDELLMSKSWEKQNLFNFAGMTNLSIGLERKINSRFSLQAEPFIKAPLRNFGKSEVRLATAGLFVSAKFKL